MATTKKAGQPSKYKKKYCKEIVKFMSDGSTLTMYANSIGVTRQTLYNWAKESDEFFYAIKRASEAAQAVFDKHSNEIALGKRKASKAEITALIFSQKARFGVSDKDPENIDIKITDSEDGKREVSFNFTAVPDSNFDPELYSPNNDDDDD